jgi:hypothetical protein
MQESGRDPPASGAFRPAVCAGLFFAGRLRRGSDIGLADLPDQRLRPAKEGFPVGTANRNTGADLGTTRSSARCSFTALALNTSLPMSREAW